MDILILYLLYLWIVLIHTFFIGISAFSLWGKTLLKMTRWKVVFLLTLPLVLLEFYWITFVKLLGLQVYTDNSKLLMYFNTDNQTNLINLLKLRWLHLFIFLIGGHLAYSIGKWSYLRVLNKAS